MSMQQISISSFLQTSNYWSKLAGVRWQFLFTIVALIFCSSWLKGEYGQDDSNLWLVMNLFLLLIQYALIGLIAFSLLSAVVTWLYFRHLVKSKSISAHVKLGDGQKAEAGWVSLSISVMGNILRPLLGSVQARLIFSHSQISERVVLDVNVPRARHWWRHGIKGSGQTLLHHRGIYDVHHVLISFCDMLGLLSLPCKVPFSQQLFTLPLSREGQNIKAQPNATEDQTHRIDIPKKVEGEYINYKEFEMGDNIQRIVWKIYAKSGQLVVRVPETKDPYASHLYFYVSFFNSLGADGAFEKELLNVYKDKIRSLYEAIQRNGYNVRLPHDQEVPKLAGLNERRSELFQIAASNWQRQVSPRSFIKPNQAAFVCLTSLIPASEVDALLKILPASVPLVVVKLSDAIASPFKISIKDIFFRPEKQPADSLRQPWLLSALRRELIKNEKEISGLLKAHENSWMASAFEFER